MVNRHIRGKLLISAVLFGVYAAAAAALAFVRLSPELVQQLHTWLPLVLTFAVINGAVALTINPWRVDRLPDRLPNIVQDAIIIVLFAIAATLILQEKVLATTAVGAVVVGFALQDTLGNLIAGLAIQVEKPFRVGHWVSIAGKDGLVAEITWRATKIRTKSGNVVVVPNSVLARDTITNYSEPMAETRIEVEVGASYDTPPNEVKAAILDAIVGEPLISPARPPEVLLVDFAASAITYRVRVWITDFAADERVRDRIRTCVYYAFRRRRIAIPYPIQVEIQQDAAAPPARDATDLEAVLRDVEIFAPLTDTQRAELLHATGRSLYAAGEVIVRQGDPGSSMFVVLSGEATVTIESPPREVARFVRGGFFGEISLLTGEPRTATVTASTDCDVLEITADAFRRFVVLTEPTVVDLISTAVVNRRGELEQHRAAGAAASASVEPPRTFIARVRRFLRLATTAIV
jgi:small-conductance mechanosensitive channel/CRP-like cAMP-binding protein